MREIITEKDCRKARQANVERGQFKTVTRLRRRQHKSEALPGKLFKLGLCQIFVFKMFIYARCYNNNIFKISYFVYLQMLITSNRKFVNLKMLMTSNRKIQKKLRCKNLRLFPYKMNKKQAVLPQKYIS